MTFARHLYLPTLGHWTSRPHRPYTWHFSTQGLPFCYVAIPERRLLPYIFTLTLYKTRRSFSVALSVIAAPYRR